KTHERRFDFLIAVHFQCMELPYPSFQPENTLEVGLPLIHPEFCKWLYVAFKYVGIFYARRLTW
ncbi:MAG: hypothetical protein Q9N02_03105, partial [Ghiorsea sp.]|nr:hypothetical protein [Ghiorsea sp.]